MNILVESKSRWDLRRLALSIRKALHCEDKLYFPIVELLDVFEETLPNFSYEIVDDRYLPSGLHAETDIATGEVRIKESVYDGARQGSGRDRMTITHEFAHYMTLCFVGFKLYRSFGDEPVKPYNDPEWQAKCLAGELLIPHHLIGGMTEWEIAEKCGVSETAARYQMKFK